MIKRFLTLTINCSYLFVSCLSSHLSFTTQCITPTYVNKKLYGTSFSKGQVLLLRHLLEPRFFKTLSSRGSLRWIDSVNLKIKSHDERGKQGFYFRIKIVIWGAKMQVEMQRVSYLKGKGQEFLLGRGKEGNHMD